MPMLLGLSWKRVTSAAAFSSSVLGFIGSVIWSFASEMQYSWAQAVHPIIPGFLLSLIAIMVITFFTKPVSQATLNKFFKAENDQAEIKGSVNLNEGV